MIRRLQSFITSISSPERKTVLFRSRIPKDAGMRSCPRKLDEECKAKVCFDLAFFHPFQCQLTIKKPPSTVRIDLS